MSSTITAAAYAFTALVWTVVAADLWQFRLRRRPQSQLSRLLPLLSSCIAGSFAVGLLCLLFTAEAHARRAPPLLAVFTLSDALVIAAVAMFRHAALLFPLREQRPSTRWLAVNYGLAALLLIVDTDP